MAITATWTTSDIEHWATQKSVENKKGGEP